MIARITHATGHDPKGRAVCVHYSAQEIQLLSDSLWVHEIPGECSLVRSVRNLKRLESLKDQHEFGTKRKR